MSPGSAASTSVTAPASEAAGSGLAAERARRQHRVDALRATGAEPYPYRFDRTHSASEVRALGAGLEPARRPTSR